MLTKDLKDQTQTLERTRTPSLSRLIRYHLSAYHTTHLFCICLIGTCFTEHLFVYTVFSPAVLYGFVWMFFFHYFIMILDCLWF